MPFTVLLALQAAAAPAPALAAIDFDLARFSQIELGRDACRRDDPNAIVVCGRHGPGYYPLAEMARIFEPHRLVAQTRLTGNLTGDVHLERGHFSDRGVVPNRIMVGVRLPF